MGLFNNNEKYSNDDIIDCITTLKKSITNENVSKNFDEIVEKVSEKISKEHHSTNNIVLDSSNSMKFQTKLILEAIEKLTLEVRELKEIITDDVDDCECKTVSNVIDKEWLLKNENEELIPQRNKNYLHLTNSGIYKVGYLFNIKKYKYASFNNNTSFTKDNLIELKYEVLERGLPWFITDKKKAELFIDGKISREDTVYKGRKGISGIKYVSMYNDSWRYVIKGYSRYNKNLKQLEKIVKKDGYEWIIIDEELAEKSYQKNLEKHKTSTIKALKEWGYSDEAINDMVGGTL